LAVDGRDLCFNGGRVVDIRIWRKTLGFYLAFKAIMVWRTSDSSGRFFFDLAFGAMAYMRTSASIFFNPHGRLVS